MHALSPCTVLLNVLKANVPAENYIPSQAEDVFPGCRASLCAHLQLHSMHLLFLPATESGPDLICKDNMDSIQGMYRTLMHLKHRPHPCHNNPMPQN